ncbi:methyltransferase domain-containing protein [Marinicrinis sediminis]|uniref:Methyltransferase domain-containing protein n=1 Tax=Marinicrinis sediminis TaxID=1652465 RepID=A0ABW5R8J1_9BACL
MTQVIHFQTSLQDYFTKFSELASYFAQSATRRSELEALIDQYAAFITKEENKEIWEREASDMPPHSNSLALELRRKSGQCVAMMEKLRAWKLISGAAEKANYFHEIESCIEDEFGLFNINEASKVLLIGSGAFPMTPLLIARRTGAHVTGIDIDEEAIMLGQEVIRRLGPDLGIRLERVPAHQLETIGEMTHIIFSSTVEEKYDILDQLHRWTHPDVIVFMRYGDQLKSLFNYPSQEVDSQKWKRMDNRKAYPDQIFDVAIYEKAQQHQTLQKEGSSCVHPNES